MTFSREYLEKSIDEYLAILEKSLPIARDKLSRAVRALMYNSTHPGRAFFAGLAIGIVNRIPVANVGKGAVRNRDLLYNPIAIARASLPEVVFFLCHEVSHLGFRHGARMLGLNHKVANVAGDLAVNYLLKQANVYVPSAVPMPGQDLFGSYPVGKSMETYYSLLMNDKKAKNMIDNSPMGMLIPNFFIDPDDKEAVKKLQEELSATEESQIPLPEDLQAKLMEGLKRLGVQLLPGSGYVDAGECGGFLPDSAEGSESGETASFDSFWKEQVRRAVSMSKHAGKMPGCMEELLGDVGRAKYDWQSLLANCADRIRSLTGVLDYMRPSRRYVPAGVIVPRRYVRQMGTVCILIDTSGSMSIADIKLCLSHALTILDLNPREMYFIYHDVDVQRVDIHNPEDGDYSPVSIPGRGGTDHSRAMNYVANAVPEAEFVICFTDGYTSSFGLNPGVPVIWAITQGETKITPPYGFTIVVAPPRGKEYEAP